MRRTNILISAFTFSFSIAFFSQGTFAWFSDPKINSVIAPKPTSQMDQSAIPDGEGGALIFWAEYVEDGDNPFDIYAQRIDSHGELMWDLPVAICKAPGLQYAPAVISDMVGGAIVVWHDGRETVNGSPDNFNIYSQRISGQGQLLWAVDGVPVCTAPQCQIFPKIVPDGMGGAVVVWVDKRNGTPQVYGQRLNSDGNGTWQSEGVLVANVPYAQIEPDVIADGSGRTIVAWTDLRPVNVTNIYSQKLDGDGKRLWGEEGLALCTKVGNQFEPSLVGDGIGGAIVCWTDGRLGDEALDLYAQRIEAGGIPLWNSGGIPLTRASGNQLKSVAVSDGAGGAVIAWEDFRKGDEDSDVFAQRVDSQGEVLWDEDGKAVVSTDQFQIRPAMIPDGAGGMFIAWQDFYREGTWWNIFAQYIDGDGHDRWRKDGIAVSIADEAQAKPVIIPDDKGGIIIIWYDSRSGSYYNVYAQQVNREGLLGGGEFKFYTADRDDIPKSSFTPGEMILFNATWTMPAPETPGTYEAGSGMVIHSNEVYREELITYEVE